MNKNESNKIMNSKENLQLIEQFVAALQISGVEVNDEVMQHLQPYIDGKETVEQAIARIEIMLAEAR